MDDRREAAELDVPALDPFVERLLQLGRVQQELLSGLGAALAEDGLAVDPWRALSAIGRLGAPTMGEIAEATGMANATLSRAVDALEDAAAVFRHHDEGDRRRITVRLTGRGMDLLVRADAIAVAWRRSVEERVGAEVLAALDALSRVSPVLR